jgi:hypothetical protein
MDEATCTTRIVAAIVAAREAAGSGLLDEYSVYCTARKAIWAEDPAADCPTWPTVQDALPESRRVIRLATARPICRTRGCSSPATSTGYCSCCEHDRY